MAFFAESQFHLTPKLTVSPGIRVESGLTQLRGTISYYDPLKLPNDINHRFALVQPFIRAGNLALRRSDRRVDAGNEVINRKPVFSV